LRLSTAFLRSCPVLARGAVAAAAVLFIGGAYAQDVLDQARSLIRGGKPQEALELLEPQAEKLNDAESSYLLGIAALDSGKAGLAVIALERALEYNPDFTPARAELARAYIATGDTDQARTELSRLAGVEVPEDVRAKLKQLELYLAETADKARRGGRGLTGYIQAEAGYDSNVNTGANSRTIPIPLFGGISATLNPIFERQQSPFVGLAGGALAQTEVQPGVSLFGGLDLWGRYSFDTIEGEHYNTWTASGNLGVQWQRGLHTATVALTALQNDVTDVTFDRQWGFYGQWQTQVNPTNDVGVFAQWLDIQHPIEHALDTQFSLVGGAWRHAFGGRSTPLLTLAAYYADDQEQGTDPTVGRKIIGGRIAYSRQIETIGGRLNASLNYQDSRYGGTNVFFLTAREDRRTDLSLGIAFLLAKDVTLTPLYVYTRNSSNIPVVDFSRHQAYVTLRKDFR
jgi:hypothetical protein